MAPLLLPPSLDQRNVDSRVPKTIIKLPVTLKKAERRVPPAKRGSVGASHGRGRHGRLWRGAQPAPRPAPRRSPPTLLRDRAEGTRGRLWNRRAGRSLPRGQSKWCLCPSARPGEPPPAPPAVLTWPFPRFEPETEKTGAALPEGAGQRLTARPPSAWKEATGARPPPRSSSSGAAEGHPAATHGGAALTRGAPRGREGHRDTHHGADRSPQPTPQNRRRPRSGHPARRRPPLCAGAAGRSPPRPTAHAPSARRAASPPPRTQRMRSAPGRRERRAGPSLPSVGFPLSTICKKNISVITARGEGGRLLPTEQRRLYVGHRRDSAATPPPLGSWPGNRTGRTRTRAETPDNFRKIRFAFPENASPARRRRESIPRLSSPSRSPRPTRGATTTTPEFVTAFFERLRRHFGVSERD